MKTIYLILLFPVLVIGCIYSMIRYLTTCFFNTDKAWQIAFQVDELANVGANGKKNTTISARSARARNANKTWGCVMCKFLNYFQKNHCDIALES